jgi:hypothetical protein
VSGEGKTGTTSLVTLALLAAGEKPDSPAIDRALEFLRRFGPEDLNYTYAIGLQTMVYSAAEPVRDRERIAANVRWLQAAQFRPEDGVSWPGSWGYNATKRGGRGDNSNTQYALLGLDAAREAGVPVDAQLWVLARDYWMRGQRPDGGWSYTPDSPITTASMTCAGIASLNVTGLRRLQGRETLQGETIRDCGRDVVNRNVQSGLDWLAAHFRLDESFGGGPQWRYYYLYGLERAGRRAGVRFIGTNDWYRQGADGLVHDQDKATGAWRGALLEKDRLLATSFALLFLARGRAPVLIHKLRHHPLDDWNRDPDDVAHLVEVVGRDWMSPLTWQVIDSGTATLSDLQRAPILFFNGHRAPEFSPPEKENLRAYIEQGGFLFAEACCGEREFDEGFRRLMKDLFPEDESAIRPLPEDHPIWRAMFIVEPASHPLWGIRRGDRTAVVYSPKDLSCYWNQFDQDARSPAVIGSIKVGQNVIDYATNRELPPDKLSVP